MNMREEIVRHYLDRFDNRFLEFPFQWIWHFVYFTCMFTNLSQAKPNPTNIQSPMHSVFVTALFDDI